MRFETLEAIDRQYDKDLVELKKRERREREELQARLSRESQDEAKRIKEGSDYVECQREKRQTGKERMQQLKDELTKPRDGSKRADKDQNDTSRNFRDNADDISRDSGGRGRSRGRKPPRR